MYFFKIAVKKGALQTLKLFGSPAFAFLASSANFCPLYGRILTIYEVLHLMEKQNRKDLDDYDSHLCSKQQNNKPSYKQSD